MEDEKKVMVIDDSKLDDEWADIVARAKAIVEKKAKEAGVKPKPKPKAG